MEILQMLKISFWSVVSGNNIVLEWLLDLKSGVSSGENAKYLWYSLISKTDENVDEVKRVIKNRRVAICEGGDMLGISSGSFQKVWKIIWTCFILPLNLYPLCYMTSKRKFCNVTGHAAEAGNRPRISFEGNNRRWDVGLWLWPRNQGDLVI